MSVSKKAKAAGGYLLSGTQVSLQVLQSFAPLIPAPLAQAAIGAACQLIIIAKAVRSNVEGAGLLTDRVAAILLVVVTPLKGKEEQDIPADLRRNILGLTEDLQTIEAEVQRTQRRTDMSRFLSITKAIIRYGDNAGLITDCIGQLDWAMQLFQVEGRIQDALRLVQVANRVEEVGLGVERVQAGVQDVHMDVKDIQTVVHSIAGRPTGLERSLPSTAIPPKPELFYGRAVEVKNIVLNILARSATRYGVIGPGGIGKTSVVSAVMQHPDIVTSFESRRYWVPCEQASSVELLQSILAKAFRIEDGSFDRMQAILSRLESDSRQHLIVLDNFETPCDIDGRHSDVLDTLCSLSGVPNLAILITMRGSLPGINRIRWTNPQLSPLAALSPDAARKLYTEIVPESSIDHALNSLLAALDYMPLAVT